ncbi:MAG: hypothetical protein NTW57_06910 [Methylophilales bacterium]|jgi:HTH-type transcriptional regulator/antitoxin HigA|nr:hypothetical protein [Methylophilales bacterium]
MDTKPIKNDEDLRIALKRLELIFQEHENTLKADEMGALVTIIEAYEHKHYPIKATNPGLE